MQSPASDRTVFLHHHDLLNSLHAPAREGDTANIKLVDSASPFCQWAQANVSYSNCLIGCAQPCGYSVVLFHQSSEPLDYLLVDGPLRPWRRLKWSKGQNQYRSEPRPGPWLETASMWLTAPLTFHVSLRTHHPTTPVPAHCTSNYHIMSLVDIGRSVHTA